MAEAVLKTIEGNADWLPSVPVPVPMQKNQPCIKAHRQCHVSTTIIERYGKPIRDAVNILSDSLAERGSSKLRNLLFSTVRRKPALGIVRTDAEMVAWIMTSIWVVGVAVRAIPETAGLKDAEKWFFGARRPRQLTSLMCDRAIREAEKSLRATSSASAYHNLLPYILDPHGPGSRLSVQRNPETRVVQERKRTTGVFYTPADVAEFMVKGCLKSMDNKKIPTVFDPACGTGVFLRAALKILKQYHPEVGKFSLASKYLFGVDIDPWPLEAAAFVLLADTWADESGGLESPNSLWQRLRMNLACIDTLNIDPMSDNTGATNMVGRSKNRESITDLFPALEIEPSVIVGNPPYARLGDRSDIKELRNSFNTLSVKQDRNAEVCLVFIEQMIRMACKSECAGALVLPLSVACNSGAQFIAARKLIQKTLGQWRFAFFDREPQALFGEDVKTRNTILFWSRNKSSNNTVIASSPLQKWRGEFRAVMLNNIRFTEFDGDIQAGIPKIDGTCQASALGILRARWDQLKHAVKGVERLSLAESTDASDHIVFVGPTAYNFLNVFLKPPVMPNKGLVLSKNPLHAIVCASTEDALVVFSLLTSHLAYWWWHTHGDGFHVTKQFIQNLPFGLDILKGNLADGLCECGLSLWSIIKNDPISSLNRGRTSLAYSPNGHDYLRLQADRTLIHAAGIGEEFVDELQQFTAHTIAAKPRNHSSNKAYEYRRK